MERRKMGAAEIDLRVNIGTLLASGMIAGEALVAIVLAILVNLKLEIPQLGDGSGAAGLLVFAAVGFVLLALPMRAPRPEPASR